MATTHYRESKRMYPHRTNLKEIPSRESLRFTERYNEDFFHDLRRQGDPYCDRVVLEMHEKHGLKNIRDLLTMVKDLANNNDQAAIDLLTEVKRIPSWVDKERVERGQRVQAVYSSAMGQTLFTGSLVGGATFKTAATVTALAGNLSQDPNQRVTETALIIAQLAFVGSLLPKYPDDWQKEEGEAFNALVRVRLLHSALRFHLPNSGKYKGERFNGEICINQHDLAITLSLFCYLNLRSLRRLNVVLSSQEINDYLHMWRYAGYLLGIKVLPLSLEDNEEFYLASMLYSGFPDEIPEQVKFVLDEMARLVNEKTYVIPESFAKDYLHQMTRFLSGDDYVTGMNIENKADDYYIIKLAKSIGYGTTLFKNYFPFGESIMYNLNIRQIRGVIHKHQKQLGDEATFGSNTLNKDSRLASKL